MIGPGSLWGSWSGDPLISVPLGLAGALYGAAVIRLWRRAGTGAGVRPWRAAAWYAGLLAVAIALLSPLDALAETLFAAHMAQHLALILVAPPLLLAGAPHLALPWLLPAGRRRALLGWWHRSVPERALRALGSILPAVVLQSAALWFWHLPGAYTAALDSETLHALEHATYLGTALLFWWAVLAPSGVRRHRQYALRIASVFVVMLQGGALGALLMFSRRAWYPVHASGAALWGMSTLEDQQLAGLVMWLPAGVVYFGAAIWLLAQWLGHEETLGRRHDAVRAATRLRTRGVAAGLAVVAVAILGVGCASPRGSDTPPSIAGGSAPNGRELIGSYGCGSCHMIPGVRDARGLVGPPLIHWSGRRLIAGELTNTPEHLVSWIVMPQSIEPGTGMPNLGVTDGQARDIAAYLYTLR
jgi:cytochrome c oxidase assembly factor CtaG/cytochrome c2